MTEKIEIKKGRKKDLGAHAFGTHGRLAVLCTVMWSTGQALGSSKTYFVGYCLNLFQRHDLMFLSCLLLLLLFICLFVVFLPYIKGVQLLKNLKADLSPILSQLQT